MSGIRILLIFTVFTLVGCNVLPGETYIAPGRYAQNYNGPSVLKETEKLINLPIVGSSATSCEILNLQNVTETSPCTCNANACTVGLTGAPNFTGVASFDYRYFSYGKSSNTASGIFNIVSPPPFVSTWRVGDVSYGDGDLTVTLPLRSGYNYNFTVDWGDGNTAEVTAYNDVDIDHTYASPGDYTITISGLVETWYFNNTGDKDKILSISELGTVGWKSFESGFYGCSNLSTVVGGNTSAVTSMASMFRDATTATPDTSGWDTSNVVSLSATFYNASSANPDTSGWNTSNVTSMHSMFFQASAATPDTRFWDTSNVTIMNSMFHQASLANPDTNGWDTSNVTSMYYMFSNASAANPDTSGWNTSNVTIMTRMFNDASVANPDTSGWDTSNVTNMSGMFASTNFANPDTSGWITSNVTDMNYMFAWTNNATPDTSGWDTSNVTDMSLMFFQANVANPDTSGWITSNVTDMSRMFQNAIAADPEMSGWDFVNVTNFTDMFSGATLSTVNYDNMLIRLDATAGSWLTLDAGSSQYTSGGAAATARSNLIGNGWTINDGGAI